MKSTTIAIAGLLATLSVAAPIQKDGKDLKPEITYAQYYTVAPPVAEEKVEARGTEAKPEITYASYYAVAPPEAEKHYSVAPPVADEEAQKDE